MNVVKSDNDLAATQVSVLPLWLILFPILSFIFLSPGWSRSMSELNSHPVPFVLIPSNHVERDAELTGGENKLGKKGNNGRRILATSVWTESGEFAISEPVWQVPAIYPTGGGGLEVSTFTEFSGQDRHMHRKGIEIYTVLKGTLQIYINDQLLKLHTMDEVVILPNAIHEVVQTQHRDRRPGEDFSLLVRVHSINCHGELDKYVQMARGGPWLCWADLTTQERACAYKRQGAPAP
jgi:quercetin dioxygenase-like cupin family protein